MDTAYFFHTANSLTLKFKHCVHVHRNNLSAITEYIVKTISVIDKSKLF